MRAFILFKTELFLYKNIFKIMSDDFDRFIRIYEHIMKDIIVENKQHAISKWR